MRRADAPADEACQRTIGCSVLTLGRSNQATLRSAAWVPHLIVSLTYESSEYYVFVTTHVSESQRPSHRSASSSDLGERHTWTSTGPGQSGTSTSRTLSCFADGSHGRGALRLRALLVRDRIRCRANQEKRIGREVDAIRPVGRIEDELALIGCARRRDRPHLEPAQLDDGPIGR